nr:hypothetical protein Itr_chr12CG04290 [Ipomoea trifida]
MFPCHIEKRLQLDRYCKEFLSTRVKIFGRSLDYRSVCISPRLESCSPSPHPQREIRTKPFSIGKCIRINVVSLICVTENMATDNI